MNETESEPGAVTGQRVLASARSGVKWTALSRAGIEAVTFASSIVLARLVSPAEFGACVVGLFVCGLALVVRDQALTVPLVQRPLASRAHYEVAGLGALVLGLGLAALCVALVPIIWAPVFGHRAAELAALASLAFPAATVGAAGLGRLQRDLAFKRLGMIELAGMSAGVAAAVALAIGGVNAEAIIAGQIVGLATVGLAAAIVGRGVSPRWRRHAAGELLPVAAPATGNAVAYASYQSMDYFLVGATFSTAQVGFYWRAYQLAIDYQAKITGVMLRVAFPVYSRLTTAERQSLRARIVSMHAAILFPILALLVVNAPLLVPFLYGRSWAPAGPLTQILAVGGFGTVLGAGLGPLMAALGRTGALAKQTVANLTLLVAAILLFRSHGLTAVAWGVAGAQLLGSISANYFLGTRVAGIDPIALFGDIVGPGIAAATMVAIGFWISLLMEDWSPAPELAITIAIMGAVYCLVIAILRQDLIQDLRHVIARRHPITQGEHG